MSPTVRKAAAAESSSARPAPVSIALFTARAYSNSTAIASRVLKSSDIAASKSARAFFVDARSSESAFPFAGVRRRSASTVRTVSERRPYDRFASSSRSGVKSIGPRYCTLIRKNRITSGSYRCNAAVTGQKFPSDLCISSPLTMTMPPCIQYFTKGATPVYDSAWAISAS